MLAKWILYYVFQGGGGKNIGLLRGENTYLLLNSG